jgi:hypothetical protein
MSLFSTGCDYCGNDQGTARYSSPYKYQPETGSVKVFCSNRCLENYKEKLIQDKELKKQKEAEEKAREEETRLREREESKERSRLLREQKKEEFKNGLNVILSLFQSNSNDETAEGEDIIENVSKEETPEENKLNYSLSIDEQILILCREGNKLHAVKLYHDSTGRRDLKKSKEYVEQLAKENGIIEPKSAGCFIATAAMGDYNHPIVVELRFFRDNWLLKKKWGVKFTDWYYMNGPKAASVIEKSIALKKITFVLILIPLQLFAKILRKF